MVNTLRSVQLKPSSKSDIYHVHITQQMAVLKVGLRRRGRERGRSCAIEERVWLHETSVHDAFPSRELQVAFGNNVALSNLK